MAQLIANAVQTVAIGGNVLWENGGTKCRSSVMHMAGSGLVTLKGTAPQCQCYAKYRISFGANIGGIAGAESVAIAVNGEPIAATTMTVTPAAVADFWNVSRDYIVDVPAGCCVTVAVENTSTAAIQVENATIIIERIA